MNILKSIRNKTGYFLLRQKIKKLPRKKEFLNLSQVRTVGVVFHQTDNKDFIVIQNFVKQLSNEGKQVDALGYIIEKEIPDSYLLRKGFNFFSLEDLNWINIPRTSFIKDFIEKEFDLLIDLSIDNYYPVEYIVALSKAKFKTGKLTAGSEYTDLLIDIKSSRDLAYLIEQIIHYLRLIKKKN